MKQQLLILTLLLSGLNLFAQESRKSPYVTIGVQGSSNVNGANIGLSGSVNVLWPSSSQTSSVENDWVATLKLSQLKRGYGNYFSAFDASIYNNLSIASLMGGYRIGIGRPTYDHKPYETGAAFYVEPSAGVSFVGTNKVFPTIGTNIGFYLSRKFDLNSSVQWTQNHEDENVWVIGIGASIKL